MPCAETLPWNASRSMRTARRALDYVWDSVKSDLTKKKAVMIDEIWKLIGASSNRQAAEFCLTIFKTIRGFGGAAISATQDLSDFFGLEDGKYGRAIINNSKTKILLNLEPDEAKYVRDVLRLTPTEVRARASSTRIPLSCIARMGMM